MKQLRKFLVLSKAEKILLVKATFLVIIVYIGLFILPFSTFQNLVSRLSLSKSCDDEISMKQIVWAVEVASNYFPLANTCLVRSIAAQILLTRSGYKSNLCIGVRKNERMLDAHAWVEIDRKVIIGKTDVLADYVRLPNLEGVKL